MVAGWRHTENCGEEREKKCDWVGGLILHRGVKVDAARAALRVTGEAPTCAGVAAVEEKQTLAGLGVRAASCPRLLAEHVCPAYALLLNVPEARVLVSPVS